MAQRTGRGPMAWSKVALIDQLQPLIERADVAIGPKRRTAGVHMTMRNRVFRTLLWLSVLMATTWVGATLFGMLVVVPTWNASPPESLRTFFLQTEYSKNIWNFFGPPWMMARNLPVFATLAAGWHLRQQRRLLLFVASCSVCGVVGTLVWIYPINDVLFFQAGGDLPVEEIRALANRWIWADRIRFGVGVASFLALLRTFSLPLPTPRPQTVTVEA